MLVQGIWKIQGVSQHTKTAAPLNHPRRVWDVQGAGERNAMDYGADLALEKFAEMQNSISDYSTPQSIA